MKRIGKRFLSSTRGQVVELLRRGEAPVSELAEKLGLTDNAVRAHLTTLERDGLIQPSGKRPGVRKPETLYTLTREAEQLYPKAYHVLLNELLSVMDARLDEAEMDQLLKKVGANLAMKSSPPASGAPLHTRVQNALEVLKKMGGLTELDIHTDRFEFHGYSCPLADAVTEHPRICVLAQALLSELVGVPVREQCVRNGKPHCRFIVDRPTGASA